MKKNSFVQLAAVLAGAAGLAACSADTNPNNPNPNDEFADASFVTPIQYGDASLSGVHRDLGTSSSTGEADASSVADAGPGVADGDVSADAGGGGVNDATPVTEDDSAPPAAPVVSWSAAVGGIQNLGYSQDDTVHGKVVNSSRNALACWEEEGESDGHCDSPGSWRSPSADWTYDSATGEWRAEIALAQSAPGTHRIFWHDRDSDLYSTPVALHIQPAKPLMSWHTTANGPESYSFSNSATAYGRVLYSSENALTCSEVLGTNVCANPGAWIPSTDGWTYYPASRTWHFTTPARTYSPAIYRIFWRDVDSGLDASHVEVTVEKVRPVLTWHLATTGQEQYTFTTAQTAYARVRYSGLDAKACAVVLGGDITDDDNACLDSEAAWETPKPPWTFDAAKREWRYVASGKDVPPGTYRNYWRDETAPRKTSEGTNVTVTAN